MLIRAALLTMMLAFLAMPAIPHSGGTNADGCHTNRRTGDYHCHGAKTPSPDTVTYCHVLHGERRCGYTQGTCNDLVAEFGGFCQRK